MADGDNKSTNLLAQEISQLEEQLQGWGEVILAADHVLRWQKSWFPGALIGVTTVLFTLIYYLDPSVLTGVSCSVMLLCLADYLVPTLAPKIFGSSKWTTEQQQRFHEICGNLVKLQRRLLGWWRRILPSRRRNQNVLPVCDLLSGSDGLDWAAGPQPIPDLPDRDCAALLPA